MSHPGWQSTGYGPSHGHRLQFDGDESKYELWEMKFVGYLRLHKLSDVIERPREVTESADGEDVPRNGDDASRNADVFAQLIQCLDDRSLTLVMRDARDDGREALNILRAHYLGKGKPRIIALYTQLTSLTMNGEISLTDYVLKAETAATLLKTAGEKISDSLLIAMILKGLPASYDTFKTVVTQRDGQMAFIEFKVSLRKYEEQCHTTTNDRVMKTIQRSTFSCYTCGKAGHKSSDCKSGSSSGRTGSSSGRTDSRRRGRWCVNCRSSTHDTGYCRKKTHTKDVSNNDRRDNHNVNSMNEKSDADHSFAMFKADVLCHDVDDVHVCAGDKLLVDCGATAHIIHDRSKFEKLDDNFNAEKHSIELADGSRSNGVVQGRGDARVTVNDVNGKPYEFILKNALYVPSYKQDIFSVQAATCNGASVSFSADHAELRAANGARFKISQEGRLYYLNNTVTTSSRTRSVKEWHKTLGHCNVDDVRKLEGVVDGMKITGKDDFQCDVCVVGKMSQYRSREPDARATCPLELVHCDLAGPVDPVAKEGFRYTLSFVDDYSGVIMVYFLKQKSDTHEATQRYLADSAPYGTVKRIRSDNGTEFTCKEFKSLLTTNRIKHETSAPYSPHQNGTVERSWRSIFEMARCLLIEAQLPRELWTYAVMASAYIRNRCYNHRTGLTPYEVMTGKKPNLSSMHVFGTICYAYVQNKKKLDARSEKGVFVGYDKGSPAYLVYLPDSGVVKRVRCVKFSDKFDDIDSQNGPQLPEPETMNENETVAMKPAMNETVAMKPAMNEMNERVDEKHENEIRRYPQRQREKPKYLDKYVTDIDEDEDINVARSVKCNIDYCYRVENIPRSFTEADSSSDSEKWHEAMKEEMTALYENETFQITPLPEGRNVVGGRWVYAVKVGPNGEERYKARFVAKGYSQIADIDYHETFSPTARMTSIRMLMQLAVHENLIVHQMDVKTAYLNAPIDCEIYVEQPEGFKQESENGAKLVCKLQKSLYGLKQSGRNWNTMLHNYLVHEQFKQSIADPCVYTRITDVSKVIVIVWVDDIIIAANDLNEMCDVKKSLSAKFRMKDMGDLTWFLGIEFRCKNDGIEMNQSKYVERMLNKFSMSDCKSKSAPCDLAANKIREDDSTPLPDARMYREIVGSLIYLMTGTRPDICYVVTLLSQHMAKPTNAHLSMARHVLRYLSGTIHYGLQFQKCDEVDLIGFSDSDWGSLEDRRSMTGYCFQLSKNGPLISWKSRKQPTVALSTCEAEYMALSAATQEAKFLTQLLVDMTDSESKCVLLYVDNQGAISLAKNPVHHQRSKHIDIRYHYVRLEVQRGSVQFVYVTSEENVADIFTKPVSRARLNKFISCIM